MAQVFLEKEDVARRERYFCLFPNDLVVLSVSAELVGYNFEVNKQQSVHVLFSCLLKRSCSTTFFPWFSHVQGEKSS